MEVTWEVTLPAAGESPRLLARERGREPGEPGGGCTSGDGARLPRCALRGRGDGDIEGDERSESGGMLIEADSSSPTSIGSGVAMTGEEGEAL